MPCTTRWIDWTGLKGRNTSYWSPPDVDTFSKLTLDKIMRKVKDTKDVTIFPISVGWIAREMYEARGRAEPQAWAFL